MAGHCCSMKVSHLIMEAMPADPGRDEFRQGNTLGTAYRHWRRAKIGRRFQLFFRYDSRSKVIVYAWDALTAATRSHWGKPKA